MRQSDDGAGAGLAGTPIAFASWVAFGRFTRWRSLALLAALLAALVLPSTAVGAEDLPAYDARTHTALDLLDRHAATSQLRSVLQTNRVAIRFVPMATGVYARYSVVRHVIEIDSRWADAEPTTVAAVIAHEATHAQDAVSGYLAAGGAAACIDSEIRAFRTAALFWLDTYGTRGKVETQDDLERQLNTIAEREVRDPNGLETLVRHAYRQQCAV